MKRLIGLLILIQALTANASPSCLADKSCFEYNGKIIDLKPKYTRDLNLASLPAATPLLSEKEFSRLVGKEGTEYFIPIDINGSDLAILAGALSLGTVVFENDRQIMDFVQDHKTIAPDGIGDFGFFLGGRQGIPLIAGGAYFMGAVLDNGKLKNIGIISVYTGLATQIVTDAFKKSLSRTRPSNTDDPYEFGGEGMSMFSGHASGAFSMATVISEIYKDKPLVPYVAYGLATVVAYSRVYENKHWASDVIGGAVIGHLVTKIIMRTMANQDRMSGSGLIITPNFGTDANGDFESGVQVEWTGKRKPREFECSKHDLQGRELVRACMDEIFAR